MPAIHQMGEDVSNKGPTPIDVLVGQNIRICRLQRGLTQTELGQRIGVSFQQVQKYENGANRVGASRITQVATALEVSLLSLFDGTTTRPKPQLEPSPRALLAKPYSLRLLQGFDKMGSNAARSALLQLVETLAQDNAISFKASRKK
jgi:transcriptional regulator with XRE-family HTH domain